MLIHFDMDGRNKLRYRRLRDYAKSTYYTCLTNLAPLADRCNSLEEYNKEDFRLRFRLRKPDSAIDKDRSAAYTNTESYYTALRFYTTKTFEQVTGDLFIYHSMKWLLI